MKAAIQVHEKKAARAALVYCVCSPCALKYPAWGKVPSAMAKHLIWYAVIAEERAPDEAEEYEPHGGNPDPNFNMSNGANSNSDLNP